MRRQLPYYRNAKLGRDRLRRSNNNVGGEAETSPVGAYFLVVNPTRRQYLDPARFGEAIKFAGVLRGEFRLYVLKLLVSDCFPRTAASFSGAWLGDPVILASDDSGLPNPGGLATATATDAARNLNALAAG